MIAELGAVKSVVELLAGIDGTVVVIVQVIVTTIYTSKSSYIVSFTAISLTLLQVWVGSKCLS
jgi:hypothetical protein